MARSLLRGLQQYLRDAWDPMPAPQQMLFQFATAADRARWEVFTDKTLGLGGNTTAELAQCPDVEVHMIHKRDAMRFQGELSHQTDADAPAAAKRMGIAGFHYKVLQREGELLDLDSYTHLRFRARSDGRHYIANIRTENWITGAERNYDIYQALLPLRRTNEWQEVDIRLNDFLLSWKGKVAEERIYFNRKAVTSIGISIAGGYKQQPGPFWLDLEWVQGCNDECIPLP